MNPQLLQQLEKAKQLLIVVEGKKDKAALQQLGFSRIFVINEPGKSLPEKIEQVQELCTKKDKVCILTDFDKKGKQLYFLLKSKLSELGVKLDNTLRSFLLKEKVSHIEELFHFVNNQNEKQDEKWKQ